jgi:hypothetical protein
VGDVVGVRVGIRVGVSVGVGVSVHTGPKNPVSFCAFKEHAAAPKQKRDNNIKLKINLFIDNLLFLESNPSQPARIPFRVQK